MTPMDLVQILLVFVVGFSVLVFLLLNAIDSVHDDKEKSDDVEQESSLLCDFDSIITTESCGVEYVEGSDDQDKEKGGGADDGWEKLAVSERACSEKIEELVEAESCGVSSYENSNILSALLSFSGSNKDQILGCDMDINKEYDGIGEGDFEDWEGLEERTELEKTFGKALVFVSCKSNAARVSGDVKLQLHGLQRTALEGVCYGSQPMALKVSARAKWNAWKKLGNMNRETAMEKYINILSEHIPEWKGEGTEYSQHLSNF